MDVSEHQYKRNGFLLKFNACTCFSTLYLLLLLRRWFTNRLSIVLLPLVVVLLIVVVVLLPRSDLFRLEVRIADDGDEVLLVEALKPTLGTRFGQLKARKM
jgi:hypothetical protein